MEMGLISPGGEKLLDILELGQEHIYHLKVRLLPRRCLPFHRSFMSQRNRQLQYRW